VTHRCHDGEFLFRFRKYRDFYVSGLYEMKVRYGVDVLDYMVTSNHVHLLLASREGAEISAGLRYLHGRMGQWHNGERDAAGAFWSDRFHATRIQDGAHLGRCLFYIDLNMVRAGVVKDPADWEHTAYHEFVGERKRYRIVNQRRLLACLMMGMGDLEQFREWYLKTLNGKLLRRELQREAFWSRAAAVGDADWLKARADDFGLRRGQVVEADDCHYLVGKAPNERRPKCLAQESPG
jgi:putative transposase